MKKTLRIATRKSPLALWQANHIKNQLEKIYPDLKIELVGMVTEGDRLLNKPLTKVGGKGLFIKELEKALLEDRADIAVHSIKDMPAHLSNKFTIAAICKREDPLDVLIANHYTNFNELPLNAVIGTSSSRRGGQLKRLRPDLQIETLRGNVNTRLQKLDENKFAAIILAAAGIKRLGLEQKIKYTFSPEEILPAVGQGALGIECLSDNSEIIKIISPLNDYATQICIQAERAMNAYLNGGCQLPTAGYAIIQNEQVFLRGLVADGNGKIIYAEHKGDKQQAELIGKQVAEALILKGAHEIIISMQQDEE